VLTFQDIPADNQAAVPTTNRGDNSGNAQTNASVLKIFAHAHFLKTILWLTRHFAHLALPAIPQSQNRQSQKSKICTRLQTKRNQSDKTLSVHPMCAKLFLNHQTENRQTVFYFRIEPVNPKTFQP